MSVDAQPAPTQPRGWFWRAYVTAWMVLAAGGLGYLTLLATSPEFAVKFAAITGAPAKSRQAVQDQGPRVPDPELAAVRSALEKLNARVAEVQSAVEKQQRTVAEVSEKVAAAARTEAPASSPSETSSEPPQSESTQTSVRRVTTTTERPTPAQSRNAGTKFPPLPTRVVRNPIPRTTASITAPGSRSGQFAPKIINQRPSQPRPPAQLKRREPQASAQPAAPSTPGGTGPISWSTVPTTVTFGDPRRSALPTTAAQTAITLSRASTLDGLRASWEQLVTNHPAMLAGLQPRYNRTVDGTYRLLAGPLEDRVSADRLCSALRTSNIACGVDTYSGNAL